MFQILCKPWRHCRKQYFGFDVTAHCIEERKAHQQASMAAKTTPTWQHANKHKNSSDQVVVWRRNPFPAS
eukprot:6159664-Amphidinium_carterae.1